MKPLFPKPLDGYLTHLFAGHGEETFGGKSEPVDVYVYFEKGPEVMTINERGGGTAMTLAQGIEKFPHLEGEIKLLKAFLS